MRVCSPTEHPLTSRGVCAGEEQGGASAAKSKAVCGWVVGARARTLVAHGCDDWLREKKKNALASRSVAASTKDDMASRDGSTYDFPRSLVYFSPTAGSPSISGHHNLVGCEGCLVA
eukprot:641667-Pelagomonas_calceolata.AAC.2